MPHVCFDRPANDTFQQTREIRVVLLEQKPGDGNFETYTRAPGLGSCRSGGQKPERPRPDETLPAHREPIRSARAQDHYEGGSGAVPQKDHRSFIGWQTSKRGHAESALVRKRTTPLDEEGSMDVEPATFRRSVRSLSTCYDRQSQTSSTGRSSIYRVVPHWERSRDHTPDRACGN
jgi:hypothetical protein